MINKETIISAFDEKLTLLQWLKKVEKALIDGILKNVKVIKVDEAHVKFAFEFTDGTTQETNEIVLAETDVFTLSTLIEGSESVVVDINESNTALEIHVDIELINRINNSLQLPLARPTEQVLVGVDTTNAENLLKLGEGLEIENEKLRVGGVVRADEIVENMSGYSFIIDNVPAHIDPNLNLNIIYAGIVKNGNKLTMSIFGNVTRIGELVKSYLDYGIAFQIPASVNAKIYPYTLGNIENVVDNKQISFFSTYNNSVARNSFLIKGSSNRLWLQIYELSLLDLNTTYTFRYETTFLLSDNLAQEIGDLD